jgi:hypothetical protein
VVCWTLVGGTIILGLRSIGQMHLAIAAITCSLLFGAYHFAHSAPFNTLRMVAIRSAIGLLTSAVFILTRDVYATLLFHNFLGTLGVIRALAAQNTLEQFATSRRLLIAVAIAGFSTLAAAEVFIVR